MFISLDYSAGRRSVVLLLVTGLRPTKNSFCGQRNEALKLNKLNLYILSGIAWHTIPAKILKYRDIDVYQNLKKG